MCAYETILFSLEGHVATLTLNRPEAMNALTLEMMDEIRDALAVIEEDREIRCLLLTGAGRGFCAGQDLRNRAPHGADLVTLLMEHYYATAAALRACRVPVVVAVNGTVAGGGFCLALGGDIVLAARSAKFIQVFSRIGLVPDLGSTFLVPQAIGRARALRMMLTNDPISAEQAAEWGLISECVDDAALMPEAEALARRLGDGPTLALAATRRLVDEGQDSDFESQFRRELEVQQVMRDSADAREGVAAFVEKRKAAFTGR